MNSRKIAARVGTVGGATLLALGVSTSAYAYDGKIETTDWTPGGAAYWTANGDRVQICDQQADGYDVEALVWSGGEFRYRFWTSRGNGSCDYRDAGDGGVFDLHEGWTVDIKVCLSKGTESFCHEDGFTN